MISRPFPSRASGKSALALGLLLALASPGLARPVDVDRLEGIRLGDGGGMLGGAVAGRGFAAAQAGTTWFGGTTWDAVDGRYEAVQDSVWTFDSGVGSDFDFSNPDVNPFKDTSLHARMEGWIGIDNSFGKNLPYFRRLDGSADWEGGVPCVGAAAGLGGSWSFWAGALAGEADSLCFAAGQGYGNNWVLAIERSFPVTPGVASVLAFDYVVEMEPGFDYAYAQVDTGGGDFEDIWTFTGNGSGTASLNLTPGIDYPAAGNTLVVRFRVASDGAYADDDGLYPTTCGAFALDDVSLSGGASYATGFESDDGGWSLAPLSAGPGGDWSNLAHLQDLPPRLTACDCALSDSVLVFEDLSVGGHNQWADNIAASPWIDLTGTGFLGAPGKVFRTDVYAELPLLNYLFAQFQAQWYPSVCPVTGGLVTSPWTSTGFVYYFGGVPTCQGPDRPFQLNFSGFVDLQAERIRIAMGVISYCRFFAECTYVSNSTPWYDNTRFGFYGTPGAPFLNTQETDLPQDSWPRNGTLRIDATGRVDAADVRGATSPEPQTSLGDTLIVRGGLGGAEVRVQFAVDPGPGIDVGAFNAWLTSHAYEGSWLGLDWYSARMDTALNTAGYYQVVNNWMTAYHEDDPNFTGNQEDLDPNDLDPLGQASRLANDIFPDDLFTAGTRVLLFYKAIHDGSDEPFTGLWYVHPDTTGGTHLEMEVMPSSMAADSTWNCVLYVDHADGRVGQELFEAALGMVITGGSDNFENTPWDRYDVRAPTSQQMSVGGPIAAEYGATVSQLFAYDTILWDSAHLASFNLSNEDANVLIPWLNLIGTGTGYNNLYLSGDGIARSMTLEAASEPDAFTLLDTYLGTSWTCDAVRDASCPGSPSVQDTASCIQVDPVGSYFTGNSGPNDVVLRGNGCPELRAFDVLDVSPGGPGTPEGNEVYDSSVKGTVTFHSVANLVVGGPDYRSVVDGGAVHARRDAVDCAGTGAVADRLQRVLSWFGYAGPGQTCLEPIGGPCSGINIPDPQIASVPNPLIGTPTEQYDNVITIEGCLGPVVGAQVEVRFHPEADALITWGPYQDHPSIFATTDANGEVRIPIMAGGCIPENFSYNGPVVSVYADGVLIAQPYFTSPDMVDANGRVPGSYQWSMDCGIVVDLADSLFLASGNQPAACYDFDGDGTPAGIADLVFFTQYMGRSTCDITGTPGGAPPDALLPASPNPFRGSTSLVFSLREPATARITIHDVSGRVVRVLTDRVYPAGRVVVSWDGRNDAGATLGAGLYFYRLVTPRFTETRKVVLLR